jgi:hypothetical protein
MAEEFTENELATIREILKMQVGSGSTADQEFQTYQQMLEQNQVDTMMTPEQNQAGSGSTTDQEFQTYQQMLEQNQADTMMAPEKMQAGSGSTTDQEFQAYQQMLQPVQPQNFGEPPQQGALPMPPDMTTEQGKAAYLQQAIENIKSRTTGRRETGSQRLANLATGALPKGAMTPEEMQQLQMMRGQR